MAEYFIGITDKGKRRENNEDTFIVQELPGKDFIVACVIDGVGGYNGGEVAAAIARSVILEQLQDLSDDIIGSLRDAVIAANEKIHTERSGSGSRENMACVLTCAIADIKNNKLYYSHVGDTRLYLLRDASLVKISSDHSAVGFLEESGRLSEDDAMRHPRRNEISKALGFEDEITEMSDYIETGESPFLPGDCILLCSDGLTDMISSNTITSILNKNKSLSKKAQELVDAANEAGGNDNITAVLVENNKQPKKQEALKPLDKKNGVDKSHLLKEQTASQQRTAKKKNNKSIIAILSLFSIGLLVALTVILSQERTKAARSYIMPAVKVAKHEDEKLIALISAVNDTTKIYAASANAAPLKLSEPILVGKDSFYFRGNGSVITPDSGYKGPAFIIAGSAKHIVLDSLVFDGFDPALILQKNNIIFRNVRFINCKIPVQYAVSFTDSAISGRFKDSIFITTQSPKKK